MAGSPRGRRSLSSVVLAELSDEEAVEMYDLHLEQAEFHLDRLLEEVSADSVRCKKLAIEFFAHLVQLRNALLRLAPGERKGLAAAFGSAEEGCERMARLLVLLNGGAEARAEPAGGIMQLQHAGGKIQAMVGTVERRDISRGVLRAGHSVAGVLDAVSLGEAVKRAQERRQNTKLFLLVVESKLRARASETRRSLTALAEQERAAASEPEHPSPRTAFGDLSMLDDSSSANHNEYMDQIFATFKTDVDSVLTGREYNSLMDEVTEYITQQFDVKFGRLNMKCDKMMIAGWVRGMLDQDGNRQITTAEFVLLKKAVDDID